ncbi:MAG: class I SAM-dependent methyltransferase [Candidatus Nanoarchaeia archaeon]
MTYYDEIARGYDALHKEEQLKKLHIISNRLSLTQGETLLDVGCGTGFSLDFFSGVVTTGVDPAKKLVEQYTGKQKILVGCAESLPFDNSSFDVVISVTAIQNFSDLRQGLQEIFRCATNRFALTLLKNSSRVDQVRKILKELAQKKFLQGYSFVEEEHYQDIFFFIQA